MIVPETNAESPPPYDIVCEPEETRKLGSNESPVDVPDVDLDVPPPPPYNENDGVIKVQAVVHSEEPEDIQDQEKTKVTEKEEVTKSESK